MHPFTCGSDEHTPGSPKLVAREDGWHCSDPYSEGCDYRQNWAHAFMAKAAPVPDEDLQEARQWARHGYEIGQRHCGWSDHGVAPAWLTEDWPRSFGSCEHLQLLSEAEVIIARVKARCHQVRSHAGPSGMINASQVLSLLSSSWPDGNFESPTPEQQEPDTP
jgi:hypothetical protein